MQWTHLLQKLSFYIKLGCILSLKEKNYVDKARPAANSNIVVCGLWAIALGECVIKIADK